MTDRPSNKPDATRIEMATKILQRGARDLPHCEHEGCKKTAHFISPQNSLRCERHARVTFAPLATRPILLALRELGGEVEL